MTNAKQKEQVAIVKFPKKLSHALAEKHDDIMALLPERLDADRFISVALIAATKNTDLQECNFASVLLAIMESARVGLQIDGKEAALIPYGGNAEFMPMFQGIKNLMLRSPGVLKVEAHVVYEGDQFDFNFGLHPDLVHKPMFRSKTITHAYAIGWRDATTPTFEVMPFDEIEQARLSSRAPNSPAWKKWYGEMSRKVVLKRLAKYFDLSPEASRAIAVDHAVIGDPTIAAAIGGVSEEYANQLVKTATLQKLSELKDKLSIGDLEEPKEEQGTKEDHKRERKEEAEGDLPHHEPDPEAEIIDEKTIRAPENHWEDYVLDFVVTEQFVSGTDEESMRIHARGILNYSPFIEIPHGELKLVPAVAWFMAWNRITEKHPKMKGENKAKKALKLWKAEKEALLELAKGKCPPDTNND